MTERPKIFTLGHSSLKVRALCDVLSAWGIRTVVDVRRFPRSRRHPDLARERLEALLQAEGFVYVWHGEGLGGFRKGGFEAYAATEAFRKALEALEAIALESPSAIMCAERDPAACHRRFIADALVRRGWRVVHVMGPTKGLVHLVQECLPLAPDADQRPLDV